MNSIEAATDAISAVCPILGMRSDRSPIFSESATAEQRSAAEAVLAAFDWSDEADQARQIRARRLEVARLLSTDEPLPLGIRCLGLLLKRIIAELHAGTFVPKSWEENLQDYMALILSGAAEMTPTNPTADP